MGRKRPAYKIEEEPIIVSSDGEEQPSQTPYNENDCVLQEELANRMKEEETFLKLIHDSTENGILKMEKFYSSVLEESKKPDTYIKIQHCDAQISCAPASTDNNSIDASNMRQYVNHVCEICNKKLFIASSNVETLKSGEANPNYKKKYVSCKCGFSFKFL